MDAREKKFKYSASHQVVNDWGKNEGSGANSGFEMYFIHGTDVPIGCKIIADGYCLPSTDDTVDEQNGGNVCGKDGVYFLYGKKGTTDEDICWMWDKSKHSGYNKGAIIICRLVGTVIIGDSNTKIEPGEISLNHGKDDNKRQNGKKKVAVAFGRSVQEGAWHSKSVGRSVRFRKGLDIPVFLGIR